MSNATALLNSIAAATGSNDRQVCIEIAMGLLVKSGAPVDVAMDALFGEGAYKRMAGEVYEALRARVAK